MKNVTRKMNIYLITAMVVNEETKAVEDVNITLDSSFKLDTKKFDEAVRAECDALGVLFVKTLSVKTEANERKLPVTEWLKLCHTDADEIKGRKMWRSFDLDTVHAIAVKLDTRTVEEIEIPIDSGVKLSTKKGQEMLLASVPNGYALAKVLTVTSEKLNTFLTVDEWLKYSTVCD